MTARTENSESSGILTYGKGERDVFVYLHLSLARLYHLPSHFEIRGYQMIAFRIIE